MRKLYAILSILLVSALAYGFSGTPSGTMSGGAGAATAFCTTCTGSGASPSFCWEITAADVDLADSGGCSTGDAQATAQTGAAFAEVPGTGKTGYTVFAESTYDAYYFTVSSDDIANDTEGTIQFDFYATEWAAGFGLFRLEYSGNGDNYIDIKGVGADGATSRELSIDYEGNNTKVNLSTTALDLAKDTWYTVTVKWNAADVDPNLSIQVDAGAAVTSNSNLTAFATTPDKMNTGNFSGVPANSYIKNIKVWKTWQ
jgi:hypothetical protein